MSRIVRLTESELIRIVRRVISENERNYLVEAYEPGTTFDVGGTTYTIEGRGTIGPNNEQCYFTMQFNGGGKRYDVSEKTIDNIQDAKLKATIQTIMRTVKREIGC